MRFLYVYLAVMNLIGFAVMGIDKAKAKKHAWRIPEKTLFLCSLLGGSLGTWLGMYAFRHKTKHWYFVVGMPLILLAQAVLLGVLIHHLTGRASAENNKEPFSSVAAAVPDTEPGSESGSTDVEPGSESGSAGAEPGSESGSDGVEPGSESGSAGVEPESESGSAGTEPGSESGSAGTEPGSESGSAGTEPGSESGSTETESGIGEETSDPPQEPEAPPADPYEKTAVYLGIPLADHYKKRGSMERCAYDIIAYQGKVYVGGGDDSNNLGPVPSYAYEENAGEWRCIDPAIPEEKIRRFQIIGGKLMFGGTDPREDWELGNYYALEDGRWVKYRNIDRGAHNYDLTEYGGAIFIGIGSTPTDTYSVYPVLKSTDNGRTFEHVFFYKGEEPLNVINIPLVRVYNFVEYRGSLYAFLWLKDTELNVFELYRYDESSDAFYYVNDQTALTKKGKVNPRDFTSILSYGGQVWIVNENGLHVTEDFVKYKTPRICGLEKIRDMTVYQDTLYLLGDVRLADQTYKSYLCKSADGKSFEIVMDFVSEIPACYFTFGEKGYYFSLGNRDFKGKALLGSVCFVPY